MSEFFRKLAGRLFQSGFRGSSKQPRSLLRSRRGQVALVMIILAALGLIFYAMTLNYSRVSTTKARTVMAAQKAAGFMGSFMASYAQQLSEEYLKGGLSYCKSTSLLKAIVMAIVLIILLVIAVVTGQVALWVAVVSAVMMIGAVVLNMMVIQPTITSQWNKYMKNLSIEGMVVEYGIQFAVMTAVDDMIELPDLLDFDYDGIFGWKDPARPWLLAKDSVSRFAIYYTDRLKEIGELNTSALDEFAKQLKKFVYQEGAGDLWGLHDPVVSGIHPCLTGTPPFECDPTCFPDILLGACTAGYVPPYPYVFDPFYENTLNTHFSFREQIGRDDETPFYRVNPDNSDWHSTRSHVQILRSPAPNPLDPADSYRIEDASGFWGGDSQVVDGGRPGIFPFLYVMRDIGVDLSALTYTGYECFWQAGIACDMGVYTDVRKNLNIPSFPQVSLAPLNALSGNQEVRDLGVGGTPDIVPNPDIFIEDTECGHSFDGEQEIGWKRGVDRFCSSEYPYESECPKHGTCTETEPDGMGGTLTGERDCACGESGAGDARLFPRDFLDDLYYEVPEFMEWAVSFLDAYEKDKIVLLRNISTWYEDEAAIWIEPECTVAGCDVGNVHCCPGSYTKLPRQGYLYEWRDAMKGFFDRLTEWIYPENAAAYRGNDVWCVPETDGDAPDGEVVTFDVNSNGVRGDLEDVVACLGWNVNDVLSFSHPDGSPLMATGNYQKFEACRDYCGPETCTVLPRSLVQPPVEFVDGPSDRDAFIECLAASQSGNLAECVDKCGALPEGYDISDFEPVFCEYIVSQ